MRALIVVCLTGLLGIAAFAAITGPAGAKSSSCVNLKVTPGVKPALKAAYFAAHKAHSSPVAGSTFYGRCGTTYWAAGSFPDPHLHDLTDQPEVFRKLPGHVWHDRGDGGSICEVPAALRKLWGPNGEPCN